MRSADFRTIYGVGLKIHSERLVLFGKVNCLGHHRLGITVSRKVGSAVVRNRFKRLVREIFRKSVAATPNTIDLVVNAKREAAQAGYSDLREELLSALERLRRRLETRAGEQEKARLSPAPEGNAE